MITCTFELGFSRIPACTTLNNILGSTKFHFLDAEGGCVKIKYSRRLGNIKVLHQGIQPGKMGCQVLKFHGFWLPFSSTMSRLIAISRCHLLKFLNQSIPGRFSEIINACWVVRGREKTKFWVGSITKSMSITKSLSKGVPSRSNSTIISTIIFIRLLWAGTFCRCHQCLPSQPDVCYQYVRLSSKMLFKHSASSPADDM